MSLKTGFHQPARQKEKEGRGQIVQVHEDHQGLDVLGLPGMSDRDSKERQKANRNRLYGNVFFPLSANE